jgi:transcriptional regulator with XRE-family HTH domain
MNKTPLAMRVGRAIRVMREATGLSQESFADSIDMHRAYYSAIERGEKNITLATLHRVAKGLGMSMSALLAGVDK